MPRGQQGQQVLERDVGEQTSGDGGDGRHDEDGTPEAASHGRPYLAQMRHAPVAVVMIDTAK